MEYSAGRLAEARDALRSNVGGVETKITEYTSIGDERTLVAIESVRSFHEVGDGPEWAIEGARMAYS